MATPCDLAQLRLWISRIRSDYETLVQSRGIDLASKDIKAYRDRLASAESTLNEFPRGSSKDRVREILATGIVSFGCTAANTTDDILAEQAALDLAIFALWPMVELRKLPKNWQVALSEIASMPLTQLVVSARYEISTGNLISAQDFGRKLAQIPYQAGILNLLSELTDPRRGGCALTAIVMASTGQVSPKRGLSATDIARWAFTAALAGIVGNRADDGLTDVYEWLAGTLRGPHPQQHYVSPAFGDINRHHGPDKHDGIGLTINALSHAVASVSEESVHLIEESAHLVEEGVHLVQEGFCLQCTIERILRGVERVARSLLRRITPAAS